VIVNRVTKVAAIGFALAFGTASARSAEPAVGSAAQGIALESALAVFETTAQIMARHDRMLVEAPQETLDFFIGRQDSSGRKVDPEAEGRTQGPARGPQSPAIVSPADPRLPQTVGVNANGPGSGASPCGTPPDTMGAVGPTQFISIVNCNVVSYNKSSGAPDGVLNTTPNNFFNSVRSSGTSDPHIRYDRTSQRWFLFIIDLTFPNNRLLVAVSNTATITGATTWRFFFVQTGIGSHTNCFADYPTPGIDANAIYAGVNQFCGATFATAQNNYVGSDLFVIQKSSVLGAGPIHATGFQNLGSFTPQGVDNADPAATEGYVIATSNTSWSQLDLFRVGTPGSSSPTLSPVFQISTANQGNPITQPHLGNTGGANGNIDGGDNRLFAATFRDGGLWTAMTVGTTVLAGNCVGTAGAATATRDAAFWWEFTGIPTGSIPSINQAGIVCDAAATNPKFYSYATIAPNGQGQAAMGFTIAGSLTFLSAGTAGRLSGDTPGALQAINIYAPGAAAYNPTWNTGVTAPDGYRRWGDFSFTSLDPCDDQSIWTIQEYTSVANQYGTRFAQLKAPPPATPASASPSTVAAGQPAASVVITGTSSAGSGFFDTPLNLSSEPCRKRIASTIPGIAVNSVTWNSPTQVTLSLDTTGATSGTKTVTITNPDGQSDSGAVLTITSLGPAPPVAGNNGPLCTTQTLLLTASTIAGATYAWTGPNGFTSSLQNPSIPGVVAANAGTYSVTATVGGQMSAPGQTTVVVNPVPTTPAVTAPPTVMAGSPNWTASVPAHAGSTYSWTITNGTITSGQGTNQITFTAGVAGTPLTLSVTETNASGCVSAAGTKTITVAPAGPTGFFYTVTPCRQLDTRSGSPISPGGTLAVALTGAPCGIPSSATSVSANAVVTQETAMGHLTIYPADKTQPLSSTINFNAGQTRANNAILSLSSDGTGGVNIYNGSGGTTHVVIDVNGYFQ
jgi:PKD-like domain